MTAALAIDIGGTKVSAAYIIGERILFGAERQYCRESIIADIVSMNAQVTAGREPAARVGISCAGLVDRNSGIVRFAGNLDMESFALGPEVEGALGLRTTVDNDARCATLGEYLLSSPSKGNLAGIIMGTGLGGGLVIEGRLLSGKNSFAGEFGHLPVTNSMKTCACGHENCLESVAGGRAFEQDFEMISGKRATAFEIAEMARAGSELAIECFMRVGRAVGEVIAQLDTALDLDSVVIGGGFGKTFPIWQGEALAAYRENLVGATSRNELSISLSNLGNIPQLVGAVAI